MVSRGKKLLSLCGINPNGNASLPKESATSRSSSGNKTQLWIDTSSFDACSTSSFAPTIVELPESFHRISTEQETCTNAEEQSAENAEKDELIQSGEQIGLADKVRRKLSFKWTRSNRSANKDIERATASVNRESHINGPPVERSTEPEDIGAVGESRSSQATAFMAPKATTLFDKNPAQCNLSTTPKTAPAFLKHDIANFYGEVNVCLQNENILQCVSDASEVEKPGISFEIGLEANSLYRPSNLILGCENSYQNSIESNNLVDQDLILRETSSAEREQAHSQQLPAQQSTDDDTNNGRYPMGQARLIVNSDPPADKVKRSQTKACKQLTFHFEKIVNQPNALANFMDGFSSFTEITSPCSPTTPNGVDNSGNINFANGVSIIDAHISGHDLDVLNPVVLRPTEKVSDAEKNTSSNKELIGDKSALLEPSNVVMEEIGGFWPEFVEYFDDVEDEDANAQENSPVSSVGQSLANSPGSDLQAVSDDHTLRTPVQPKKRKRNDSPRESVKKRKISPKTWIKNVAKEQLNLGKAHTTSKGMQKPDRKMGPGCSANCRMCDKPRITENVRSKLFSKFWKLGAKQRHWDYLSRHVSVIEPQRKSARPGKEKHTRKYFFTVGNKPVKVCKTMFFHTLGIADCWMQTALKKIEKGGNQLSPDKRGKHTNRPQRIPEATKQSVRDHIALLPRVHAHYTRERTKREYLEEGLSIARLHEKYLEWAAEEQIVKPASLHQYTDIFNTEHNIGFFVPKKYQCLTCNKWKTRLPHERAALLPAYNRHLQNKAIVKALKIQDKNDAKENKHLCVASFDLQKVLQCPKSEVGTFFYKNKLSLLNFTIFVQVLKIGYCFLWDETVAKRGSNEIGSHVYHFLQEKASEGYNEVRLYSDACSGQNRNRFVFGMYLLAAAKYKIKVTHRFLDSYSEVDYMHARIETEARPKNIYSQDEWCELIESSKRTGESYRLIHVQNGDILDFSDMIKKQNWKHDVNRQIVLWSKVREVTVDPERPNELMYKYNFEDEPRIINVSERKGRPLNMVTYEPPKAYKALLPLKAIKVQHLTYLCNEGAIPTPCHQFYQELFDIGCDNVGDACEENATYSEVEDDDVTLE